MSASNTEQGREVLLSMFDVDEGIYLPICYTNTKDWTVDSPVAGTTSQCTTGSFTDAEYTGYDTGTFNIGGNADVRPNTPTFLAYQKLRNGFLRGEKRRKIEISDRFGTMQTSINITNFSEPAPQEGLVTFTMTFQITGDDFILTDKAL